MCYSHEVFLIHLSKVTPDNALDDRYLEEKFDCQPREQFYPLDRSNRKLAEIAYLPAIYNHDNLREKLVVVEIEGSMSSYLRV